MFRRRRRSSGDDIYGDLRGQALAVVAEQVGLHPSDRFPNVYGVLMDMGFPEGSATLVALADGTTSLYTSTGGGMIGGGEHEQVAAATQALVSLAEEHLDHIPPSEHDALPEAGRVVIHALTYDGRRAIELPEDDLGYDRHALSGVFHAAHEVITQLRLLEEGR